MQAMELRQPGRPSAGRLTLADRDPVAPGAGELTLRVAATAVCRTDLQIVEGDLPARRLPIVPGHQVVGKVTAVGEGVTDWSVGDRAGVIWLAGADGTCDYCLGGRENLCPSATFTGWDRDGGFADEVTVAAAVLRPPA